MVCLLERTKKKWYAVRMKGGKKWYGYQFTEVAAAKARRKMDVKGPFYRFVGAWLAVNESKISGKEKRGHEKPIQEKND